MSPLAEIFGKLFCSYPPAHYFRAHINPNAMKKALVFLTILLAACSKSSLERNQPAEVQKATFFSHVRYFKDGRKPSTDTVWTLRMMNQQMTDSFARYDGKVYWESSWEKEVGVLWSK